MSVENRGVFAVMEAVLLGLENPPWRIVYRAGIGFCFLAAYRLVDERCQAGLSVIGSFFLTLLVFRFGLAYVRRFMPVSERAKETWAARRDLAKRFDSYQWRKLLGLSIGLIAFQGFARWTTLEVACLSLFCVIGGGVGEMLWRRVAETGVS